MKSDKEFELIKEWRSTMKELSVEEQIAQLYNYDGLDEPISTEHSIMFLREVERLVQGDSQGLTFFVRCGEYSEETILNAHYMADIFGKDIEVRFKDSEDDPMSFLTSFEQKVGWIYRSIGTGADEIMIENARNELTEEEIEKIKRICKFHGKKLTLETQ